MRGISKPRMHWQEREKEAAREAQRRIWDAAVKAQQDWNAKPRAEQVADARFVLHWSPKIGESVLRGEYWMTDALGSAKRISEAAAKTAAKLGVTVEEVWALMQLPKGEVRTLLQLPDDEKG